MNKLKRTSQMVKILLEEDTQCRNSDSYLYLKVVSAVADSIGIDLRTVTIHDFLLEMHGAVFPPFETVRRARQKVQEHHPELCATKAVQDFRTEEELEYRSFARCDL